ncbi:hypothetical protein JCM8547_003827 [Rhodosporidiobolus lusitaniae]
MPSPSPYRLERRESDLDKIDEKDDEDYLPGEMVQVRSGGFESRPLFSSSSRPGSPDSAASSSPLLSTPTTPFSFSGGSPLFSSSGITRKAIRRSLVRQGRSNRAIYLAVAVLGAVALLWREQERPVVQGVRERVERVASRAREERCRMMPWLAACPDPFEGLTFAEDHGEVLYPASAAPSSHSHASHSTTFSSRPPSQPHPIHCLIRDAEAQWHAKVSRQSRTLEEAVAEYKRRYGFNPPRGFDAWYRFAVVHNVQLVDEYDSIMDRILPYAALHSDVLQKRSAMLQNVSQEEEFWLHKHSVTIKVREKGMKVTAEGPFYKINNRADQTMALLQGMSQFLPDLNITITGHDVPWIVLGGEHKQQHIEAAKRGEYIDDFATHKEDWSKDGWTLMCPPDSPMAQLSTFENRTEWSASDKKSFIGTDHLSAMDVCKHPENQAIHGYTSWTGPRPGLLLPMFSFSTTSLNSDLLLPPLEQYERQVGPDPSWADKKNDKAVWRGSTTGSDLTAAHARKHSQRVRLAKLPYSTGQITVPLARHDRPGFPGPVEELTGAAIDFADEYLDIKFQGRAQQCGDEAACARFEKDFEWDASYMPEEQQNSYKYVIDVDGNGWSGRFHRLMSSNSLVLKSTIFPEWYSDRIQPWVHYVPLKTDYTDLFPVMAFFKGSPYDGQGGHDDLAEKIASAGKLWAEQNWRWVDMQAYFFRLLLEYNRIMQRGDDYHSQDYVAGDSSSSHST